MPFIKVKMLLHRRLQRVLLTFCHQCHLVQEHRLDLELVAILFQRKKIHCINGIPVGDEVELRWNSQDMGQTGKYKDVLIATQKIKIS